MGAATVETGRLSILILRPPFSVCTRFYGWMEPI